jgi:hypothetical protein
VHERQQGKAYQLLLLLLRMLLLRMLLRMLPLLLLLPLHRLLLQPKLCNTRSPC